MARFAVDYEGWIYVEAGSESEAQALASEILSVRHPYDEFGGDWEITGTEIQEEADA